MSRFYNLDQAPFNSQSAARAIAAANNGLLFDIGDMSTLYRDAAGTIPVTAVGQPIGKILDKSGNGNHATQPITASRPTLSARYNLLTKTEDFSDEAWIRQNCSAVKNYGLSPIGTLTSSLITNTAVRGYFSQTDSAAGTQKIFRGYVKNSSTGWVRIVIASIAIGNNGAGYYINTQTGAKGAQFVGGIGYTVASCSTELTADGWVLITLVVNCTNEIGRPVFTIAANNGDTNAPVGATVQVWGFDQRVGAASGPYQRVNTATDYDTNPALFPKYLKFDGVDDYLSLPFMSLYGGAASIIAARDAVSQATDTYIISERSTTNANPKYFPSRQLASGGNMDTYISDDAAAVVLDTTGSAFSGASDKVIRSVVDTGNNIKLFKNGALAADDNYTRAGTLTLNNTTIGASVSTTTSNYASMKLYGLIVTKSALTDAQRRACERHLSRKAGVTL